MAREKGGEICWTWPKADFQVRRPRCPLPLHLFFITYSFFLRMARPAGAYAGRDPARAGRQVLLVLLAAIIPASTLTPGAALHAAVGPARLSAPLSMRLPRPQHHNAGRRTARVGQLVQQEVSGIIRSGTIHGPRAIQERLRHMISIIDVDVSPDLRNARIKVSVIGDRKDKVSAMRWLKEAETPIRHVMAQELSAMRRVPRLSFMFVDVGKAVDVMVRGASAPNTRSPNTARRASCGTSASAVARAGMTPAVLLRLLAAGHHREARGRGASARRAR